MIGVLGIQGNFAAHRKMLDRLGVESREVRTVRDLEGLTGIVLPGGESTTMLKFLKNEGLMDALRTFAREGKPILGTCAGAILLAKDVTGPAQESLDLLDIGIQRNGYGRQVDSFITEIPAPKLGETPLELVFIRAPIITRLGEGVETLVEHDGKPVCVRQGNLFAATFHPEMTEDTRLHALFVNEAEANA